VDYELPEWIIKWPSACVHVMNFCVQGLIQTGRNMSRSSPESSACAAPQVWKRVDQAGAPVILRASGKARSTAAQRVYQDVAVRPSPVASWR
jgi:hypothetical protein